MTVRRAALLAVCVLSSLAGGWFALRGLSMSVIEHQLAHVGLGWLAVALATFGVAMLVRAVRWWVFFPRGRRPELTYVTEAMFVGYLFNNILPARAGEAARVIALRRSARTPVAEITGTVISERLVDTAVLVALFAASTPWLPDSIISTTALTALAGVLAAGCAVVLVLALPPVQALLARQARAGLPRWAVVIDQIGHVRTGLTGILSDPAAAAAGIGLTAVSWLLLGVSDWCLLQGFGLQVGLVGGILISLATGIAMVIPSAPASLGVFEATTVLVLRGYPVDHAAALGYAVTLHALNIVPLIAAGGLALLAVSRRAEALADVVQLAPPADVAEQRLKAS
jgi:glycosyltransferase 2 family protein